MTEIEEFRKFLKDKYNNVYKNKGIIILLGNDVRDLEEKEEFLCALYMMQEHYESRMSMLEMNNRMQKMFAEAKKL